MVHPEVRRNDAQLHARGERAIDSPLDGAAFDALCALDVSSLDGAVLEAALRACRGLRARLDGIEAQVVAAGEESGLFRASGAVDTAAYLRDRLGISGREARARADTATGLASLPETASALSAGEITLEHAAAVTSAADDAHGDAIAEAERSLVDRARRLDVERFRRELRAFCDEADHDRGVARAERLRARRQASQHVRADGMGVTVFELPPDDHAYVASALGSIAEELWRADHPGEAGPVPILERSHRQRLADAAVEMARRALGASASTARDVRPIVIATMALDDLTTRFVVDGGALADASALAPDTVRRLACDADVLPVIFDGDGIATHLGRTRRLPDRHQRRALVARDRGCRFPGCDRPHQWCQAHHIIPWDHGGPTDLDNLLLLCSTHHHLVHEGGWTLTGPAHTITIRRPDGDLLARELRPRPARSARLHRPTDARPRGPDDIDRERSRAPAPASALAHPRLPAHA